MDIRKTKVSSPDLWLEPGYEGPVFVKSNLNSAGIPEHRLARRSRWHRLRLRLLGRRELPIEHVKPYAVYDNPAAVPPELCRRPHMIVQKFLPEVEDGRYFKRRCFMLGERIICCRMGSSSPIVERASKVGPLSWIDPAPEVLAWRRRVGLDYGAIDYVVRDGEVVVLDVNKTPGQWPRDEEGQRDYERIMQHIAPGLYDLIPSGSGSSP